MQHISFFCLPAAMSYNFTVFYATTFESFGNSKVFNNKFGALKLQFLKILPHYAKAHTVVQPWLPEDKKDNMWHGRGKCCGLCHPAFSCMLINHQFTICSFLKIVNIPLEEIILFWISCSLRIGIFQHCCVFKQCVIKIKGS